MASAVGSAIVIAAFVASLFMLPLPDRTGPPDLPQLLEQFEARARTDLFSARPAYLPEPPGDLSTASPPSPLVDATLVSKAVPLDGEQVPYLVPDTALPLRYQVERRLAERFGLEEVVAAMSQWDGIPGSRWATEFVSITDVAGRRPRQDGISTVYLRDSCPEFFLGGAFWNSAPGTAHLEIRYGTAALYSPQIDLAICDGVGGLDTFRAVVAHEVGHMMGMAHLCEPGEICWRPELADAERRCRVMYFRFGPCRAGVQDIEHDAARHLYPALPRLFGPSVAETSARAAYATTWTHTADPVVLASTGDSPYTGAAAAALAGTLGSPLLLAEPDPAECVTGASAEELSRVAANPATVVLVGLWPDACEQVLGPWDLDVERLEGVAFGPHEPLTEPVTPRVSVSVADAIAAARRERDEYPDSAQIVLADGSPDSILDAAAAAAVAGSRGVPLLYTEPSRLSGAVRDWLARHPTVRRVQILGKLDASYNDVLDELVELGLLVVRVSGADPVERAVRLAERERSLVRASDAQGEPVVIASRHAIPEALVAAGVSASLGGPLLLTGNVPHETVLEWLRAREPRGGYVVGDPDTLPYPLQWAYGELVVDAADPAPSRTTSARLLLGGATAGFQSE